MQSDLSHTAPACLDTSTPRVFSALDLSDNDGQTDAHWRPGKGKIDWAGLLAALQDIGYAGVLSIELEDVPGRASAEQPSAGAAFDRENRLARDYLTQLAAQLGIQVA